jgi:predicted secreted protein
MKKSLALAVCAVALAACQAPQAKKYSDTKRELPAVALAPAVEHAVIYEAERGSLVAVKPGGTVTVYLSANSKSDSKWRLSFIPDPTVLKLVSQEFVPTEGSFRGEEKWVFEAVGEGEIDLRLWYTSPRREAFGSAPVFACIVAVGDDLAPVAAGPDSKAVKPASSHRAPRKAPKTPKKQTPAVDESAPFSEPVFRSSSMMLRDQNDRRQQQG